MATVTDNFNRANGGVGANYANYESDGGIVIDSNEARAGGLTTFRASLRTAESFGNDQYAESTAGDTSAFQFVTYIVRGNGSGGSRTGYQVSIGNEASAYLTRVLAGDAVVIAERHDLTLTPGFRGRLEVVGTTLRVFIDSVEVLSTSDANIASGAPGLGVYESGTGTLRVDDAEFGDIGGASFKPAWARNANVVIQ